MKKELNLVEILKDCPRGTKLYSVLHGEVSFLQIKKDDNYSIVCYQNEYVHHFTAQGRSFYSTDNGECILFPSKNLRDWSKFKIEPEMIDGEFYYCVDSRQKENCFISNSFIFIYKENTLYKTRCYAAINTLSSILFKDDLITNNPTKLRRATEEEKQQLLNVIEIEGYKWYEDKKELMKVESKFDLNTLKPFDKVLVRDGDNERWRCSIFSYIYKLSNNRDSYVCACHWKQCVPYNEETRYLVGTKETPSKKYINWEE